MVVGWGGVDVDGGVVFLLGGVVLVWYYIVVMGEGWDGMLFELMCEVRVGYQVFLEISGDFFWWQQMCCIECVCFDGWEFCGGVEIVQCGVDVWVCFGGDEV